MSYQSLYKIYVQNNSDTFNKIYNERFNSTAAIKFPIEINNSPAFFFYDNNIMSLLNEIREYDHRVNKAFSFLPEVAKYQYIKQSLIDEIHFTNQIEGVISTRKDIFNILEDIKANNKEKQRLESIVNKYQILLNDKLIPLDSTQDIRNLYDEMLSNEIKLEDIKNLPDGKLFRKDLVHIYSNSSKIIHTGIHPEEKIINYLNEALIILHDKKIDPYIRIAIFHYLFAYIHPFYDGNGRMARFISSYFLSFNCTEIIKYRLSMSIKENLSQYLEAFIHTNDIRNKGDISTFVYEFLDIILKAYQKTEIYALEKSKQLDELDNFISTLDLNDKEANLLYVLVQCELFSEFGLSINNLTKILNTSRNTCNKYLSRLKELNYVKSIPNGKYIYYSANIEAINKGSN